MKNQHRLFALVSLLLLLVLPVGTKYDPAPVVQNAQIMPKGDLFSGLPIHYLGESANANGFSILLNEVTSNGDSLQLNVTLDNATENEINLFSALKLYSRNDQVFSASNLQTHQVLAPMTSIDINLEYQLPVPVQSQEDLRIYRLVYMPRGYSDAVFVHAMVDRPTPVTPPPQANQPLPRNIYGTTGDPWKMLVLIYPNIDTNYVDLDGQTKHLTASMPAQDLTNMQNVFLNLPHRDIVYGYSDATAELEAHIVVVDRPLTSLAQIYNGYWPSPDITRPEMDLYAPKGKYDSVIVLWQASHPTTGQSIPNGGGWGWGYWPGETYANGMTYASIYNLSWVWTTSDQACHGEVFLHEWLHGVTGFYASKGVPFPVEDLHGAEEAGYSWDIQDGCWDSWLRDYMRGMVYENSQRKALVPELSWHKGSITTWNLTGWRGEYFNNETLSDVPVLVRGDLDLNFFWELGSPHPLVNSDHFSARWTRTMNFSQGIYRFSATRDDGLRIWVDDVLILDKWEWGYTNESVEYYVTGGPHVVRVEMYEIDGWASTILNIGAVSSSKVVPSTGTYDGYILEYSENSGNGGTLNTTGTSFYLGDDRMDRQYRSILHFDTSSLPENAVITDLKIQIKQQGTITGTNPFTTHGNLMVDIMNGAFGGLPNLVKGDFRALPSLSTIGVIPFAPTNGWYLVDISDSAFPFVNLIGATQFRLYFALDDNDDRGNDVIRFYSGNAASADRPSLLIEYYTP